MLRTPGRAGTAGASPGGGGGRPRASPSPGHGEAQGLVAALAVSGRTNHGGCRRLFICLAVPVSLEPLSLLPAPAGPARCYLPPRPSPRAPANLCGWQARDTPTPAPGILSFPPPAGPAGLLLRFLSPTPPVILYKNVGGTFRSWRFPWPGCGPFPGSQNQKHLLESQPSPLAFQASEEDEGVESSSEEGHLLACSSAKHSGSSMATLRAWGCVPGAPRVEHNAIVFALLGPSAIK